MRRLRQFEPLVIHDFEESIFHMESHAHTYYEIGYIYKGRGIHHLNQNAIDYKTGDIFLLCPEDSHTFTIKKTTRFVFIKFTEAYFNIDSHTDRESLLQYDPIQLMRNKLIKERKLDVAIGYQPVLRNIIDVIIAYNQMENTGNSLVVFHQVISILALVRELLNLSDDRLSLRDRNQEQLISYIHDHIYMPEMLKISAIAKHFNIAPSYFSAFFSKTYQTSYRNYVNSYKASLISNRMASKQYTLRQITDEFGFTDESHLSRFFKKYHQISPGAYQRNLR